MKIGNDLTLMAINDNDGEKRMPNSLFYGEDDSAKVNNLSPEGSVPSSISCFIVETGGKKILFDTGNGTARGGKLVERMKNAGIEPGDIDVLMLTHFHMDHLGGMVQEGKKVFANADVYVPEKEYAAWMAMSGNNAKEAIEHGFAMITEERKANGLFLKTDLTFNTTIANLNHYKSGVALSDTKMVKATADEIKVMNTKCMGPDDMITSLSGGNQQKVIFGRWLERNPNVFMMDEPTRGIDVGAKYEIYELIINMAKQGKTIIVVSSEMPEILGITNRIGVMSNGHLSGIVNTKETNQEELLRLSAMYL